MQLEQSNVKDKGIFSPGVYKCHAISNIIILKSVISSLCVFSVQTLEGCEILLGPEVTYGPPVLDLFTPVAMSIAHCAEVDAENWNIQLKRKTQDSKWEVRVQYCPWACALGSDAALRSPPCIVFGRS